MKPSPRVLVTGASGYLGSELVRLAPKDWQIAATYLTHPIHSEKVTPFFLDVRNQNAVSDLFSRFRPNLVIHLAALMQGEQMFAVNAGGAHNISQATARSKAVLIHLSSDVIFDGEHSPYKENDSPNPISPYGESKALAEAAVRENHPCPTIIRTSLIYGFDPVDPRTLQTITGAMPNLFLDEYRCPVFVTDLAAALIELANLDYEGVLNVAGPQRLSRYEFGLKLAQALQTTPKFSPELSSTCPFPRPRDCTLDISLAKSLLHHPLRSVDQVLDSGAPRAAFK